MTSIKIISEDRKQSWEEDTSTGREIENAFFARRKKGNDLHRKQVTSSTVDRRRIKYLHVVRIMVVYNISIN